MTSDRSVSRCVSNGRVCLDGLCSRQEVCFKAIFDDMSPEKFVDYFVKTPEDSASIFHYLSVSTSTRTNAIFNAAEKHPYFNSNEDKTHGKPVNPILTFPYEFITRIIA